MNCGSRMETMKWWWKTCRTMWSVWGVSGQPQSEKLWRSEQLQQGLSHQHVFNLSVLLLPLPGGLSLQWGRPSGHNQILAMDLKTVCLCQMPDFYSSEITHCWCTPSSASSKLTVVSYSPWFCDWVTTIPGNTVILTIAVVEVGKSGAEVESHTQTDIHTSKVRETHTGKIHRKTQGRGKRQDNKRNESEI